MDKTRLLAELTALRSDLKATRAERDVFRKRVEALEAAIVWVVTMPNAKRRIGDWGDVHAAFDELKRVLFAPVPIEPPVDAAAVFAGVIAQLARALSEACQKMAAAQATNGEAG